MKISVYYNEENDCLSINTTKNVEQVETIKNITLLKDSEENVIGVNIYNTKLDESGYLDTNLIDKQYLSEFTKDVEPAFVYGEIVKIEKHPKSDKLKICQVDLGNTSTQIVCGASNCEVNKIAVVAQVGAVMPNGSNIVDSKLINVESNGMLCSTKELGFKPSEGIKLFEKGSKELGSEVKREDLL